MNVANDSFSSTPALGSVAEPTTRRDAPQHGAPPPRRKQPIVYRPPQTLWGVWARVTRAYSALAVGTLPVCGALLSFGQTGQIDPFVLFFALLTTITLTLAIGAFGEYSDYRRSQWPEARHVDEPSLAGAALLAQGYIGSGFVLGTGLILLCIGITSSLWWALLGGWPVLFFVGSSTLLMTISLVHPTRQSFLGWGLADLAIFLACGPLGVAGSFYSQTQTLSDIPFWTGVPLGLLIMLVFYTYNIIHLRRDWVVHKRTLAVLLGYRYALNFGIVCTVLAYISILLLAVLTPLSLWMLVALTTLPLALGGYSRIHNSPPLLTERIGLYRATVLATIWTGLLFCLILWMDAVL